MRLYAPTKKGRYWTPPEEYRLAVQWCRCYPLWIKELSTLPDTSKAISYNTEKIQSNGGYDSTAETAIRRSELTEKVRLINDVAKMVSSDLWSWILKGTTENLSADKLISLGMPCSRNLYYRKRQQFYHILSKRI